MSLFGSSATTRAGYPSRQDRVCAHTGRRCDAGAREGVELKRDPLGSVDQLQLETRAMCSPGLEVEVEFAAPLALGRSVGDDDLDRVIVDLVGNAAPPVEEVP